jgi:hypothetical protein
MRRAAGAGVIMSVSADFLAAARAELVNVHWAEDRGELAVRKEIVECLSNPEVSGPRGHIPRGAILRSSDDWRHRWT